MSKYSWKAIAWRDLWLIPILFVTTLFFGFTVSLAIMLLFGINKDEFFNDIYIDVSEVISSILAYLTVIMSFYLLHRKEMKQRFRRSVQGVKQYGLWIVGTYIVTLILLYGYNYVFHFIPERYQYDTTQNELALDELMDIPALLPFNFLLIVIIGPILEEIFFRHLLIGELGKKLNFNVMAVVSVILFAAIHVTGAASPFEIVDYLIISIPLVFLYMKSGRNLGVSIAFHMLNNLISFF